VNSIQVKHSRESGREYRERDIADWGEMERLEVMRETEREREQHGF
jgi:hypothetical protein